MDGCHCSISDRISWNLLTRSWEVTLTTNHYCGPRVIAKNMSRSSNRVVKADLGEICPVVETSASENEIEHNALASASTNSFPGARYCDQERYSATNSEGVISESASPNNLSMTILNCQKRGKKQKLSGGGVAVSSIDNEVDSSYNESRQPKHQIPSAQRKCGTSDVLFRKSCTSKARPTMPTTTVPALDEFSLGDVDRELPCPVDRPDLPDAVASADGDEFGVYGLVDSWFDDRSSAVRRNKQNGRETSSVNTTRENKSAKVKQKSSKTGPSYSSSASSFPSVTLSSENSSSDVASSDFLSSIQNTSLDIAGVGNKDSGGIDSEPVASCSHDNMQSSAIRRRRINARKPLHFESSSDVGADKTHEMQNGEAKSANPVGHFQFSSSTAFDDISSIVDCPESESNVERRKRKSVRTKCSCCAATTHAESMSTTRGNSRFPDVDTDRLDLIRGDLGRSKCKRKASSTVTNFSAATDCASASDRKSSKKSRKNDVTTPVACRNAEPSGVISNSRSSSPFRFSSTHIQTNARDTSAHHSMERRSMRRIPRQDVTNDITRHTAAPASTSSFDSNSHSSGIDTNLASGSAVRYVSAIGSADQEVSVESTFGFRQTTNQESSAARAGTTSAENRNCGTAGRVGAPRRRMKMTARMSTGGCKYHFLTCRVCLQHGCRFSKNVNKLGPP